MLRALSYTLFGLLLTISVGSVAAGVAEIEPELDTMSMLLAGNAVSLQQAAKVVKKNYGGQVVKAETQTRRGRLVHHIRLINKGRVQTVLIDVATGREIAP